MTSVAALDLTLVTAALPVIVGELGVESDATSVVSAHLVTSAIAVAAVGPVSDVVGRRRLTFGSLAVLGAALAATALAPTLAFLLLARAVAGLGSGALLTLSQARVADEIPSRDRGRAQGTVIATVGVATAAGPALGGLLVGLVGWRSTFLLQLPLVLIALVTLSQIRAANDTSHTGRQLDVRALLLLFVTLTGLVGGLQLTVTGRLPLRLAIMTIGIGAAAGIAFTRRQRRETAPLVRLESLSDRSVQVAFTIGAAANGALYLLVVLLPIQLQGPLGLEPTIAGVAQLPLLTAFVLTSAIVGRKLSDTGRTGRWVFGGGIALVSGFAMTSVAGAMTSAGVPIATATALLLIGAAVAGAGTGAIYPTLLIAAQNVTAPQDLGAVTGLLAFGRQLGALIALAAAGAILARMPSSAPVVTGLLGVGLALGATAVARHLPDRPLMRQPPGDTEAVSDNGDSRRVVLDLASVGGVGSLLPAGRLLLSTPDINAQTRPPVSGSAGIPCRWLDVSGIELDTPPGLADPITAGVWLASALERSGPQLAALLATADVASLPLGLTGGRTGGRVALLGALLVSLHESSFEPLTDAWPELSGQRDDIWGDRETIAAMLDTLTSRHGSIGAAVDAFGLNPVDRDALVAGLYGPG